MKERLLMHYHENYWIEEFRKGHADALNFFFELHYKSLLFFSRRLVQCNDEAEDIVSDTFFKLWQRHQDFETAHKIKAFLFVSCRNSCLNYLQHAKVKAGAHQNLLRDSAENTENMLSLIIKTEVLDQLHKEIDTLPEKMQEIFKLIYLEGKNTTEIAAQLKLSVQTVRNQKTKAVDLLKTAMLKRGISESVFSALLLALVKN